MAISGYETGPIGCEAALLADFDVDIGIPISGVVSQMDSDRKIMAARPGMRSKYTPLRFDPATGARQIGGRYLFDTWDNMLDYMRFTSEELEFEPGVKFWQRPFFSNIDKQAWQVIGAYDFVPLDQHLASRVERFDVPTGTTAEQLQATWRNVCDGAEDEGLAAVWFLLDPDGAKAALVTAAVKVESGEPQDHASETLSSLERRPSLSRYLGSVISRPAFFDRTSLNLAIWLPRSGALDGDACVFPSYPTHPLPSPVG